MLTARMAATMPAGAGTAAAIGADSGRRTAGPARAMTQPARSRSAPRPSTPRSTSAASQSLCASLAYG